ncbi:MAG: type VII toxin-antitoxin system MntA family adenylyltransferase antitoxin [Burkholderiales bacterium]
MGKSQIIAGVKDYFAQHARGVVAVYVFGSVARGESRAGSDIDIGVLFAQTPAATLSGPVLEIEGKLEQLLGKRVQLVALNDAPVDLMHRVLRDGEIVFESDRSARIRFEVAARNEYFDLLPILRRYRKMA